MLNADSLKRCYDVISSLRDNKPLWIPKASLLNDLSFYKVSYNYKTKPASFIYSIIHTHSEFEEYMSVVKKSIDGYVKISDLDYCNAVWKEIIDDKYIRKSFNDAGFPFDCSIQPDRYARYVILTRLLELSNNKERFDYWHALYDFSKVEVETFENSYLQFHEKLVSIMYGYESGELRTAYVNGVDAIKKYKSLLENLIVVEKELVFKYLFDKKIHRDIEWDMIAANEILDVLITNRNDETLSERAFVSELLKLYMKYSINGNRSFVSLVYRFTRASFIVNDIERKTIQRCWESLCRAMRDGEHAHDRYFKMENETVSGTK